ncbi:uncharacterized protein [Argopecten irradians]|uniref:uncharacterized protein n=1 Tax=Argopecten irradians TaxID=31199 RepID=UPI003721A48C
MAAVVQTAVRKKGQATCIHHTRKSVEFLCEGCNELACTTCVGSRDHHRGHELTELNEIAEKQKLEMIKFIKEVENIKLPHIKENKESIDKEMSETVDYFDKMETTIQERGVKLKKEIDGLINGSTALCRKMKAENVQRLTEYKKCLEDGQEGLAKQLHECKTHLQDSSVIELCDVGRTFRSLALNIPEIPRLHTAVFEEPPQFRCYLELALGTLTANDLSTEQSGASTELPSQMMESTSTVLPSAKIVEYSLLPQTSIMGRFHTERIGNRISPTGSEKVWISYSDILQLVDKKGIEQKKIQFNVRITDISISPRTKNIWVCSESDSSITECVKGNPILRFHCKSKPICLCVTATNEILIGMSQRVTRFSQHGKPLNSTKSPTTEHVLIHLPQKIAECRLTQDVAVVERQSEDEISKKQVIVMDKGFGVKFRYVGNTLGSDGAFDPWDVTFDTVGNILIADSNNHSVLLVSSDGTFLKTVFTDERSTQAICLDKNLVLWAVFGDVVKRLQYYSTKYELIAMAVPAQTAVRRKGQTTCIHHTGKSVEFICEQCNELACTKCVGSRHRGHELTELSEIAEKQKLEMINFIKELENIKLPHIKENKESIDKEMSETVDYFDKMETTIQERGVKLKNEIDGLINGSTSLCRKMKAENVQRLTEYKKCLEDGQEGLAKQLHECKTHLQDSSVIELCDVGRTFRSLALNIPEAPGLHTAVFEEPSQFRCYLEQALGTLVVDDLSAGQPGSSKQPPSPMTESASTVLPTAKPVEYSEYSFLPQTSIMGRFYTERICNRINPTDNEKVWISYSDILQLVDKKGKVQRKIQFKKRITDFSISPRTKNIWVCSDSDSSITECTKGIMILRFHCKNKPICLYLTATNDILVGMSQSVTKFSQDGKPLLSTKLPTSQQVPVHLPQKITECRLTQDVAVVERQSENEISKKQVIVMDKGFGVKFRYVGNTLGSDGAFDPWDVTFDTVGNILIADSNNHSVLLVSSDGTFLKTVFTDERSTQAICLDKNLVLWAVFGDVVKRLQYYSTKHE